jgi:hypothetical protein
MYSALKRVEQAELILTEAWRRLEKRRKGGLVVLAPVELRSMAGPEQ